MNTDDLIPFDWRRLGFEDKVFLGKLQNRRLEKEWDELSRKSENCYIEDHEEYTMTNIARTSKNYCR